MWDGQGTWSVGMSVSAGRLRSGETWYDVPRATGYEGPAMRDESWSLLIPLAALQRAWIMTVSARHLRLHLHLALHLALHHRLHRTLRFCLVHFCGPHELHPSPRLTLDQSSLCWPALSSCNRPDCP